ncbi:aromatic amino acid lyase [Amycolatopsis sp. WQ 127309]|uniref:aromatic amino acid lyase n=1 Tax=Amycolatopsis sp. WQ 127309 TaxID=2932773 RepID=UPI001FF2FA06|nr:aromatic amino acid lyase [Amycolatopsis sp. WQ 127309]UOZ06905.1 aromatic amino acid lyase [Amycolatopsis sp. WQ 127309]
MSPGDLVLTGSALTPGTLRAAVDSGSPVKTGPGVREAVIASRDRLDRLLESGRTIYGVNTSMGGFVNYLVPTSQARTLQENLLETVATNVGPDFGAREVRAMMIARLNSLARGMSGLSDENFGIYLEMINRGVVPRIPSKGSLGASGDLGPLGYIALVGIGRWHATVGGRTLPGAEALKVAGIEPMHLDYKEGLALINGTSAMTGLGALVVEDTVSLLRAYEMVSCLSLETLGATRNPFDPRVHRQKPHPDQEGVATRIYDALASSELIRDEARVSAELGSRRGETATAMDQAIEDAYSLRCTPQILGPVWESVRHARDIVGRELNSSNDNPLILAEPVDAFHNGHFHGQYISMAMDHVSIALTTVTNLADRRIDRFLDASSSLILPPFLCAGDAGLRFGFMGGQFMSTSLAAENRSLCVPLSIQTLTCTGDFQDIVSMGLIAARRAQEILGNLYFIVAFELLAGCQAADIRGVEGLSDQSRRVHELVRERVPYLDTDHELTSYLTALADLLRGRGLEAAEASR